jgi:transcriptional regulator with XRE-family HTH domain
VAEPEVGFAGVLRELRRRARLTRQELADAATVSLRPPGRGPGPGRPDETSMPTVDAGGS